MWTRPSPLSITSPWTRLLRRATISSSVSRNVSARTSTPDRLARSVQTELLDNRTELAVNASVPANLIVATQRMEVVSIVRKIQQVRVSVISFQSCRFSYPFNLYFSLQNFYWIILFFQGKHCVFFCTENTPIYFSFYLKYIVLYSYREATQFNETRSIKCVSFDVFQQIASETT